MKITEQNSYRPITIVLETEEEAQELLGILDKVQLRPEHTAYSGAEGSMHHLRDLLRGRLGVPMSGLYIGTLRRNS